MKVTFVVPPDELTGGMRVIVIYAEHLQRRGHEVKVVSLAPRRTRHLRVLPGRRRPVRGFLARSTCDVHTLDKCRPVKDVDLPDADVVIATWWGATHWVVRLDPSRGARVFFLQDYGAPGQELERLISPWRLGLHVVTIARWLERLVLEHAPDAQVDVVDNAVDLETFRQPPREMPSRPTLGFVYREAHVKGYDTVLEAYRLARREVPNLRLVTFGPVPRNRLRHLPPDVEYHAGPADAELAGIYGACTAWIFASRLEGYGLPIVEAMACRTPVIATSAGAAPELIERGGGWLVPPDDPHAMAKAMVTASGLTPADWESASATAHASVRSYTWQDAGDAFERALQRAVSGTDASRPG